MGAPSNAAVIIADSDTPSLPTVSITANLPEASETGPTAGQFTVSRTGDTTLPLTVNYAIGGTAINGTDYSTLSGSVTIPASSATATITAAPIDDVLVEATETVILTLRTNTAYTMGTPGKAMVTITDSDSAPLPTVSITANQPDASESGSTAGQFTVTRTGITASDLTVTYTIGGTATNTTDYATLSGSVTITAGSATGLITVTPVDDAAVEGSETVILTLTANTTYTVISPSSAIVTIADNDSTPTLPTVSIAANLPDASETGPTAGQFILTRTGDTTLPLTVIYMIGGTATNDEDYEALPTNVPIDPHPYELLEPFYIAAKHDVGLALQALEDIGWTLDPGGQRENRGLGCIGKRGFADGLLGASHRTHRSGIDGFPYGERYGDQWNRLQPCNNCQCRDSDWRALGQY
ncbi:MAG: Calx-beta domain-containing protein [Deltaproteobacteria bacterium]|nr:Calx-beta domain-containing protein [Deltaproteobacteria bacterium]